MSTAAKTKNSVLRGPLFHLAIVGVSVAAAAVLWTRDDEPEIAATSDVIVWAERPSEIQRIGYESKTKKVVLFAKTDAQGSYLVGTVDMETPPAATAAVPVPNRAPDDSAVPVAPPAPSGSAVAGAPSGSAKAGAPPAPAASAVAGAPSGSAKAGAPPAPAASAVASAVAPPVVKAPPAATPAPANAGPPGRTILTIFSITAAAKVTNALAPFKAMRAIGKVTDDHLIDFGLAEPEGTTILKLSSGEKRLLVGALTPGGGNRYVKEAGSSDVFVVRGEAFRFLESPDAWMIERELHEWKEADVQTVKLTTLGKTHAFVHSGPEGKKFWAYAATPTANEDTLNNWMSRLFRLRAIDYVNEMPPGQEMVWRVEFIGSKPLGFLELWKGGMGADGHPEYIFKTEWTRIPAKAPGYFIDQMEQDLVPLLK